MAYGTITFICVVCQSWLCSGCSEVHRRAHQKFVRVDLLQWGAMPPSFAETVARCHVCAPSKEVRARIQCKHCSYALCLSCGQNAAALSKFLIYHEKRHTALGRSMNIELLVVYPEGWYVMEERRVHPCPCHERPATAITHCQRCHLLYVNVLSLT